MDWVDSPTENKEGDEGEEEEEKETDTSSTRKRKMKSKSYKAGARKGMHNYILLLALIFVGKTFGVNEELYEFARLWLRLFGVIFGEFYSSFEHLRMRKMGVELLKKLTEWLAYGDVIQHSELSNFADIFRNTVNIKRLMSFIDIQGTWWNPSSNMGGSFETDNYVRFFVLLFTQNTKNS